MNNKKLQGIVSTYVLVAEMRGLAKEIIAQAEEPDYSDEENDSPNDYNKLVTNAAKFAEKFLALDKLILEGGALPKEWKVSVLGELFEAYKKDRSISTSCTQTLLELEKAHRKLFGIKNIDNIENAEIN